MNDTELESTIHELLSKYDSGKNCRGYTVRMLMDLVNGVFEK